MEKNDNAAIKTLILMHFADITTDRRRAKYKDGMIDSRTCKTMGGNDIDYPDPTSSLTAS